MEFANQMSELGIKVNPKGASWDDIYRHQFSDPVVWGWGSNSPIETYNLTYSTGNGQLCVLRERGRGRAPGRGVGQSRGGRFV